MVTLSVIIPCYNNGIYLKQMLDCFLLQTVDYWEVIIVDDQSTDDTQAIIQEYTTKDSRFKLIVRNRLPKGSATCRNIGFENSVGQYICHLDADDLISNTFVEHRVEYIESHPELDYASFCAKIFWEENKLPKYSDKVRTFGIGINTSDLLEDFLSVQYSFSVWNNIYRRAAIKNHPWDEAVKIQTDFSYIVPGILRGMKHAFAGLPEVDYYYRQFKPTKKSNNMCSNFVSDDKCESTIYLFKNILELLQERDDSELRKSQFLRFIVLQFERFVGAGKFRYLEQYITMLSSFYPSDTIHTFISISNKCREINNAKIRKIVLEFNLYKQFKYKIYRIQFIHTIAKIIFHR